MKGRLSDGRVKPRKDVWMVISVVILALYALFMIYPLFMLLRNAVIDSGGQFTLDYFVKFLSKQYYLGTVLNSFKVSISATILTMIIGVPLAYFYNMYEIKGARFLQIIIILCSMSAPFSPSPARRLSACTPRPSSPFNTFPIPSTSTEAMAPPFPCMVPAEKTEGHDKRILLQKFMTRQNPALQLPLLNKQLAVSE